MKNDLHRGSSGLIHGQPSAESAARTNLIRGTREHDRDRMLSPALSHEVDIPQWIAFDVCKLSMSGLQSLLLLARVLKWTYPPQLYR